MGIQITIDGDTPLEALALAAAFGLRCQCDKDVYTVASRLMETEMAKEAAQNPKLVADLPSEPYVEEPPHGEVNPSPGTGVRPAQAEIVAEDSAPIEPPKLEEVRAEGLKAARAHGQPAIRAILDRFGAENMTSLAEKDRAPFLEALRQLGKDHA